MVLDMSKVSVFTLISLLKNSSAQCPRGIALHFSSFLFVHCPSGERLSIICLGEPETQGVLSLVMIMVWIQFSNGLVLIIFN